MTDMKESPVAILLVVMSMGCGSKGRADDADSDATADATDDVADAADTADGGDVPVDSQEDTMPLPCNAGSRFSPGTPAFREVTEEWGLAGVQGTRLSVTDVDGDGWADVLVRNGAGPDDFGSADGRRRWVMRNDRDGGFEDVTRASGLLVSRDDLEATYGRPGEVWATGDVDNDGDLDIFTGNTRVNPFDAVTETSELMLNNGDGTFSFGPEDSDARMVDVQSKPSGVTFVDFDRDGNLDLWITHNDNGSSPIQDRLLQGDGTGWFADVTYERGLYTRAWTDLSYINDGLAHSWGWSSLACDLNNDGILELMASSYGRAPNHLWRGSDATGTTTYINESVASGYAYDDRDDWTLDLNAQCYCEDNPTGEQCDLAPTPADYSVCTALFTGFGGAYRWDHETGREPFRLGGNSGATVCADLDNDGWFDLVTHEIVHWDVGPPSDPTEILLNSEDPLVRFGRPGNSVTGLVRTDAGMTWDHGDMSGVVFDFDNDTWQDVYIGASDYPDNRGLLFHHLSPMRFSLLDTDDYFVHWRSHGVVVADFDHDGDLDMIVGHSLMRCSYAPEECDDTPQVRMYENLMDEGTNYIQLALEGGPGTNRAAIGARVEVTAGGVTQSQQVDGGHGHWGTQRDLVLHFGLGPVCEAEVTIHWPDAAGSTQTLTLAANRRYLIVQE